MEDIITKNIGTGSENIRIIKDFMSPEDREQLLNFCKQNEKFEDLKHFYGINVEEEIRNIQLKYSKKMIDISSNYYQDKSPIKEYDVQRDMQKMAGLLAHPVGSSMHPHVDVVGYMQGSDTDDNEHVWEKWTGHLSSVVCLNDDYSGGELSFPGWGISIKPKAGMLVTFPGNKHYVHEVKEIFDNTRFTLSMWIRFAEAVGNPRYSAGIDK